MTEPRYRFGPLERRGLLLGLRLGQLVSVVVGAAVAVLALALAAAPGVAGAGVAVAAMLAGGGAAFWPLGGRSVDEWFPVAARWAARWFAADLRFVSRMHLQGHRWSGGAFTRLAAAPAPAFRGLSVVGAHLDGRAEMGVVRDAAAATYTAVIAVRGTGFALLDAHAKARRLSWWGSLLDGLSREGSHMHRLQWVERSTPGSAALVDPAVGGDAGDDFPAARSYRALLAEAAPAGQRHVTYLAVQISASRSRRAVRRAGGGDAGACAVLSREVTALWPRLVSGELLVDGVLSAGQLAGALRTAADPSVMVPDGNDLNTLDAWPSAVVSAWSFCRTASAVHATYWIREWPRIDVGPDVLAPLLLQSTARRTVAMTMQVEPPLRAQREAEAALTADLADEDMRQRAGFVVGFRRRREQDSVVQRGEEIAAGHASVRFSAYVTVSAPDVDALERACGEVEQRAHQAHLELQRLAGEQDVALTYTLPLARGLR